MITPAELHRIGSKLRAQGGTRGDWLTYIDGTLPLLLAPGGGAPECAACAARRKSKAAAQKRWRKNKEKGTTK